LFWGFSLFGGYEGVNPLIVLICFAFKAYAVGCLLLAMTGKKSRERKGEKAIFT